MLELVRVWSPVFSLRKADMLLSDFRLENPGLNLQHFERCFLRMLVRSLTDKIGLHQSNGHTMITYVDGEPALVLCPQVIGRA